MKKALIVGASGLVGGYVLDLLLASPHYSVVISVGRKVLPVDHPKLEQRKVSFDALDEQDLEEEADDMFCCLGTTIKKAGSREVYRKVDCDYVLASARLGLKAGVRHFLIVTALGANPDSRIFYNKIKGETEQLLEMLAFEQLSILQPSLLLGDREEFRLGEKIGACLFKAFSWMFVGKLRKYRAIPALWVARTMFEIAQTNKRGVKRYESDLIEKITKRNM
ncbi:MAG: oxidoreductase [Cytophagales bacterium]|nr:oxidoreductase [Cytophagales bacterium]